MEGWCDMRTAETKRIEDLLRRHFQRADAYRFNSASIRVRVIDERFEGLPVAEREDLVMPVLETLPPETYGDILMLLTIAPGELIDAEPEALSRSLINHEFETPAISRP